MKLIYPRKRLDIQYKDIIKGLFLCINPFLKRDLLIEDIKRICNSEYSVLPLLSVRTGFDLLFRCIGLPKGSEIAMTGITIKDMIRIPIHHGLRIVPIDLNMKSLQLKKDELRKKINSKTLAIVIAHLFGAIIPLDILVDIKERYPQLLIIEDVAQSYKRTKSGRYLSEQLTEEVIQLGKKNKTHSYWVFPIQIHSPKPLLQLLRQHGIDSAPNTTQLSAISDDQNTNYECKQAMLNCIYLPINHTMELSLLKKISQVINDYVREAR